MDGTVAGGQRRSLASLVTLLVLFVLIIGPLSAFVGLVIKQAISMSDHAIPWLQQHFGAATSFNVHDWLVQHFPSLADYIPPQEQLVHNAGVAAKSAAGFLVTIASRMTAGTATFVLNLFVMVYAMFFFLKDGKQIMATILRRHSTRRAGQDENGSAIHIDYARDRERHTFDRHHSRRARWRCLLACRN